MKRILALGLAGASASAVVLVGMTGDAVALTSTTTTITSHHPTSRPQTMQVSGVVKPAPAASGEHMVVKYYKKNANGTWTKVDTERPGLATASSTQPGAFITTMYNSPTTGKCKIVARYPGDDTYEASKAVARVMCRTGQSL
jgi:hypothetical protein